MEISESKLQPQYGKLNFLYFKTLLNSIKTRQASGQRRIQSYLSKNIKLLAI